MLDVKIQPVTVFPDTATTLKIVGANIRQLGEGGSAVVAWQLSNGDNQLKSGALFIEGEEYNIWGADDSYLATLVLAKLGLTPFVEEPTPPSP